MSENSGPLLSSALQKLTGSRTWLRRIKTPHWKPKHVSLSSTALLNYVDAARGKTKLTQKEMLVVPGGARPATHSEQLRHGKEHMIIVKAVESSEKTDRGASVRTLSFAANTSLEVDEWVDMLNEVSFARMGIEEDHPFVHPFLQRWGHVAQLRVKDVIEVAREMNLKLSEDKLKNVWREVHGQALAKEIHAKQFLAIMTRFAINKSLRNILHGATGSSWTEELDATQLGRVLGLPVETAEAMLKEHHVEKCNHALLLHFLYSPANSILDPDMVQKRHDMTQPLTRYLISSSHNTYLTGDQVKSDSSAEMYRIVLERGCRCVEIDAWDGDEGEPIVRHGRSLTSSESLENVLETINLHSFSHGNPYPVILSIENHLCKEQQLIAARMIKKVFGDRLYAPRDTDAYVDTLPSPEDLKHKIIIKAKKCTPIYRPEHEDSLNGSSKESDTENEDSDAAEEDVEQKPNSSEEIQERIEAHVAKVISELSELVFLAGGNRKALTKLWKSGISGKDHYIASSCVSINEKRVFEVVEKNSVDAVKEYNSHALTRTYPKGTRVDSSNYNPLLAHALGCQIVALNWQCNDTGLIINQARFMENAGCGYVLQKSLPSAERGGFLLLRILSAFLLPRSKSPLRDTIKKEVIDAYCQIKVYDANFEEEDEYCTFKRSTEVAKSNGFAPSWDHSVSIPIIDRGLAVLNFSMYDRDRASGDDLIGYLAIPVSSIRSGIRSFHLNGADGLPLKFPGGAHQPAVLCDVRWKTDG